MVSYPRRQQYHRLFHAVSAAAGTAAAALLALFLAGAGAVVLAAVLLVIAGCFGLYARHWFQLAHRSGVGAASEAEVRHRLPALEWEGWRLRHSLPWRGRGDIDSVAIAPTGIVFAIETKTRAYDERHLNRCGSRRLGWGAAGEGGAARARCRSCASFAPAE